MTDSTVDVMAEPTPISAAPSYFAPPAIWFPVDVRYWLDEGEPHFTAEVNPSGLTNAAVAWLVSQDRTDGELARMLAPRVRNWNVLWFDIEVGDWGLAPDPATVGEAAFWQVPAYGVVLNACRRGILEALLGKTDPQKKEPAPSESGHETTNANDSEPGQEKTRTRRRQASTSA